MWSLSTFIIVRKLGRFDLSEAFETKLLLQCLSWGLLLFGFLPRQENGVRGVLVISKTARKPSSPSKSGGRATCRRQRIGMSLALFSAVRSGEGLKPAMTCLAPVFLSLIGMRATIVASWLWSFFDQGFPAPKFYFLRPQICFMSSCVWHPPNPCFVLSKTSSAESTFKAYHAGPSKPFVGGVSHKLTYLSAPSYPFLALPQIIFEFPFFLRLQVSLSQLLR